MLGNSRGKLAPKKVKMAMAAEGASRHYLWHTILPRHWRETARRCGLATVFDALALGYRRRAVLHRKKGELQFATAALQQATRLCDPADALLLRNIDSELLRLGR